MNAHIEDPMWETIRSEALENARREPILASFLHATILNHHRLEDALSFHLANKLGCHTLPPITIREVIDEAFFKDPSIVQATRADLQGVVDRDPACREYSIPLLYFKGFQSIQAYRVAHWLWNQNRRALALSIQSRISEAFAVDIHPAARIGRGLLIDHATSIVIGETAVIGENCSFLHEVTLGGTGKESGDRHPKIGDGVLIGAGAKVLGNIRVGTGAKIAAGSVVLKEVPPHCTVAGVPAVVVGRPKTEAPALDMDHLTLSDENGRNGA